MTCAAHSRRDRNLIATSLTEKTSVPPMANRMPIRAWRRRWGQVAGHHAAQIPPCASARVCPARDRISLRRAARITRSSASRKRDRSALENSAPAALPERVGRAQVGHQVAGRQHHADVGGGQLLAVVLDHPRARRPRISRPAGCPRSPPHRPARRGRRSTCRPRPGRRGRRRFRPADGPRAGCRRSTPATSARRAASPPARPRPSPGRRRRR